MEKSQKSATFVFLWAAQLCHLKVLPLIPFVGVELELQYILEFAMTYI